MRFCILAIIVLLFIQEGANAKEPRASRSNTQSGIMIVLGFTGDLGISDSKQPLSVQGAIRHGDVIP